MMHVLAKYGRLALALAAIFLSGQAIGWLLAVRSSEAHQEVPSDPERWQEYMLARLREELKLTPEQEEPVRQRLAETAQRMQRDRDRALFQIHLQLLKLHDELGPTLTPDQQKTLAESRRKLTQSIRQKFPKLLRDTDRPKDFQDAPPLSERPPP